MNIDIEHIGLPARDPRALKDWYVRVLGGVVVFEDLKIPAFLVRLGNGPMVEIYPSTSATAETANNALAGWRHVALRVDNLEFARTELERRGLAFTSEIKPAGGGGRVLFFPDPENNLLHLVERPLGQNFEPH
jgi:glyoxylase I family protein